MLRLKYLRFGRVKLVAIFLLVLIASSLAIFLAQKPKPALAAVARTGSVTNIQNSADSGTSSVSVPSDATLAVLTIEGFNSTRTKISGFTSLTLGGNNMSLQVSEVDGGTDGDQCGIFTLVNPPTGTQTLSWNWGGSTAWGDGGQINIAFYSGVNTSTPIGTTGAGTANPAGTSAAANTPASAGTLTASSGDAIVAVAYYSGATLAQFAWTGVSAVNNLTFNSSNGSYAEVSPSGNTAVSASVSVANNFVDVSAVVIKQGARNSSPAAPTLISPLNTATNTSAAPLFQLRTTDADNDYLRYKIQLCQDASCVTVLNTFDQTASQSGWLNQDQQSGTAYTGSSTLSSSTIASFLVPNTVSLSLNTTYYWRAYAIDPAGTNTFSSASTIQSFKTVANSTNVQINGGTKIQGGSIIE